MTDQTKNEIPPGYWLDHKGRLVPDAQVRPQDKLQDQTVRECIKYAAELSEQIARFKGHTFDDLNALMDMLREEYGAKKGGSKGNVSFTTYDGLMRVTVQMADHIDFGPELQIAKDLIDECIQDWTDGSKDEIRALVNHAFQVDKPGQVNRAALFSLRRIQIDDDRWRRAIAAINDSIQITGSKAYVRFYRRAGVDGKWQPITIDLAAA